MESRGPNNRYRDVVPISFHVASGLSVVSVQMSLAGEEGLSCWGVT